MSKLSKKSPDCQVKVSFSIIHVKLDKEKEERTEERTGSGQKVFHCVCHRNDSPVNKCLISI